MTNGGCSKTRCSLNGEIWSGLTSFYPCRGAQLCGGGRSGSGRPGTCESGPGHCLDRRCGAGPIHTCGRFPVVQSRRLGGLRHITMEFLPPGTAPQCGPFLLGIPVRRQLSSLLHCPGHCAGRIHVLPVHAKKCMIRIFSDAAKPTWSG